jgi:Protein of unknown function (DUF4238)
MAMWAKHHLLPEFYLRHFVDPDTPAGMKNPYVWRYDLAEQHWQRKGPENKIFTSRYYYAFQNKKKQLVTTLEPWLSAVESRGAALIRQLAFRTPLTEREVEDFSLFIAQLMFRTPQSRVATASWLGRKCQKSVAEQIQHWRENPEEFERGVQRYRDKSGKSADITIEDMERAKPKLEPRDGTLLGHSMLPTIGLAARLLTMSWRIFCTEPEHWLVICDQPCALILPDDITEETFRGFLTKDIEFHVPMTPNMLFAAFEHGPRCAFGGVLGSELVAQLNREMVGRAKEFIVSPKPSFLGDDMLVGSA